MRALRTRTAAAGCLALLGLLAACAGAPIIESIDGGRLGTVRVVARPGASGGLVFVFSDASGSDDAATAAARALAAAGQVAIEVDTAQYLARLAASDDGCHYLVSELENLSKRIQHDRGFPTYRTPVLAGLREGGTLAEVALAQSPAATVAGAAAVVPAATLHTRVPLCPGAAATAAVGGGFRYALPETLPGWLRVDDAPAGPPGERLAALARMMPAAGGDDPALAALPLVEYPVSRPGRVLAVIYSGDGGWRDLDKQIGELLAAAGTPVVGVDCLRYFWRRQPPDTVAADLAAILRKYGARWGTRRAALVGYSFGADVLPFAVNRLPAELRGTIALVTLLGPTATATFQFSIAGWLGADAGGLPVLPEIRRLDPVRLQCVYGEDDAEQVCTRIDSPGVEIVRTKGSHHFDGDYAALARRILDGVARRGPAAD